MDETRVSKPVNSETELSHKEEWTRPELKIIGMEQTSIGNPVTAEGTTVGS